jgi:membrane protein YdbS with pleckstrin-like domain
VSNKKEVSKEIKKKKMSEVQESNWFPIFLLIVAAILAIANIFGFLIYPYIFTSFSVFVFTFIIALAIYLLYNILQLLKET